MPRRDGHSRMEGGKQRSDRKRKGNNTGTFGALCTGTGTSKTGGDTEIAGNAATTHTG
jgi:hypothetical protein